MQTTTNARPDPTVLRNLLEYLRSERPAREVRVPVDLEPTPRRPDRLGNLLQAGAGLHPVLGNLFATASRFHRFGEAFGEMLGDHKESRPEDRELRNTLEKLTKAMEPLPGALRGLQPGQGESQPGESPDASTPPKRRKDRRLGNLLRAGADLHPVFGQLYSTGSKFYKFGQAFGKMLTGPKKRRKKGPREPKPGDLPGGPVAKGPPPPERHPAAAVPVPPRGDAVRWKNAAGKVLQTAPTVTKSDAPTFAPTGDGLLDRDRMAKWLKDAMPKPTESPRPFPVSSLPVSPVRENAPVMGTPSVESRITNITSMLPPPAMPAMAPPVAPLPPVAPDKPSPYRALQSPALSLPTVKDQKGDAAQPAALSGDTSGSTGSDAVSVLRDLLAEMRALRVAMERGGESNLTIEDKAHAPELPEGKRSVSMFAGGESKPARNDDRGGRGERDPLQMLGILKEFFKLIP